MLTTNKNIIFSVFFPFSFSINFSILEKYWKNIGKVFLFDTKMQFPDGVLYPLLISAILIVWREISLTACVFYVYLPIAGFWQTAQFLTSKIFAPNDSKCALYCV